MPYVVISDQQFYRYQWHDHIRFLAQYVTYCCSDHLDIALLGLVNLVISTKFLHFQPVVLKKMHSI